MQCILSCIKVYGGNLHELTPFMILLYTQMNIFIIEKLEQKLD